MRCGRIGKALGQGELGKQLTIADRLNNGLGNAIRLPRFGFVTLLPLKSPLDFNDSSDCHLRMRTNILVFNFRHFYIFYYNRKSSFVSCSSVNNIKLSNTTESCRCFSVCALT